MRILYHHRTRAEDAQGIHILEMVNAFRKLGHHVEVVGIVSPNAANGQKRKKSWISRTAAKVPPVIYELLELMYNFYGFYMLKKKVKQFKPDFIYERYALNTFAGILVSKLYHIPLILEVNAPLAYEKLKYTKLCLPAIAMFLERWICSNTHKTIVVSTPLKKILQNVGVPEDKMVVIPNGINPGIFCPKLGRNFMRKHLGLNDKTVLGFAGWFRKWHGLEELLRIYVNYNMLEKNIHLLLVGDGPAYADLESFARQNGIFETGITFAGPVPRKDVPKYIAAFDIALQPDVTDYASPIKLFEYMGMGKGIIAPDKKNIKEIVKNDYGGLFAAGDWDDMAKTIFKYAHSGNKIIEFGKMSRRILVENKYFWIDNARKAVALVTR